MKAARRGGYLGVPLVRLFKMETREGWCSSSATSEGAVGAGMRGAMDVLKVAEHPKDVARLASLAALRAARPARS